MKQRQMLSVLLVAAAARCPSAQVEWVQMATVAQPSARHSAGMSFDAARRRAVVFGGLGATVLGDTWEWDALQWSPCSPAHSPPARIDHRMVFDAARGVTLLFGGTDSTRDLADSWIWNGADWSAASPVASPAARYGHAMVYDSQRGQVVLFGGATHGNLLLDDTWTWDGTNWQQATPAVRPSPRSGHAMAYDEAHGTVVLFGGYAAGAVILSDTWLWDGTSWQLTAPAVSPSARTKPAFFDGVAQAPPLLFGGYGTAPPRYLSDAWQWNGTTWVPVVSASGPGPRQGAASALDPVRGAAILFGGDPLSADTWETSSFHAFGRGCPGSAGLPRMLPAQPPVAGQPFSVVLTGLPVQQPGFAFIGFSNSSWGLITLPVELSPVGMPGCVLYTPLDLTFAVASTGSTGSLPWGLVVPPGSQGTLFFCQAAFPDAGTNPAGLVTTNGVRAVVQ